MMEKQLQISFNKPQPFTKRKRQSNPPQHDINRTPLLPYIFAERVTQDREIQDKLIKKAERIYATNSWWRAELHKAKDMREYLLTYMYHWENQFTKEKQKTQS